MDNKINTQDALLIAQLTIQRRIDARDKWRRNPYESGTDIIRWNAEIRAYKDCINIIRKATGHEQD